MDRLLKSNWFVKIISFLIALMLFAVVNSEQQTGQTSVVKENQLSMKEKLDVQYNKDKYVVTGYPETVTVQVKGDNSLLTKTGLLMNRSAYIDLTGKGTGSYTAKVMTDGYPSGLAVSVVPSSVQVDIEKKVTKEFPVSIDLINQSKIEKGYSLGDPVLSQDKVQVTGGKKEVSSIAFIKGVIDVTGANSDINKKVQLNAYDASGNQLSVNLNPATINVKVPLQSPSKTVPVNYITTGSLPAGQSISSISLSPSQVTIFGPKSVLDKINVIDGLQVSLDNITKETKIPLNIPLPDGVEKVDPISVTADVKVGAETTKQFTKIPIEVLGLSNNEQVEFNNPKSQTLDIDLKGTKEVLSQIGRQDIELYIDVSNLSTGKHTVEVKVNSPEFVTTSLSQNTVDITLSGQ